MKLREVAFATMFRVPQSVRRTVPRPIRKALLLALYAEHVIRRPRLALKWLLTDRETNNFTYDLGNPTELASCMAVALNVQQQEILDLFDEIENDGVFREQLNSRLRPRRDRNPVARYGRRVGWYAVVRIFKPRLVVESGVHDGLGSSILLRGLERNHMEGFDGVLVGIDIDPAAGWLVPDTLRARFRLVIADSLAVLPSFEPGRTVDLFIHDSNHQYGHEIAEYRAIEPALSPHGILLSDNAQDGSALQDYAARGRTFHFCRERSQGHFYPGAGIGISSWSNLQ